MIRWRNEKRRVGDLIPWTINPRRMSAPATERLLDSIGRYGQASTIAIGPDGEIYDGHQRVQALRQAYGDDYVVDVRVAERALTEPERKQLSVYLHRGAFGEWDMDRLLSNFDFDDLVDWGFERWELGIGDDVDVIGVPRQELDGARENNNMRIMGTGANVALNFGEIMTTLPSDIYQQTRQIVMSERFSDVRSGMIAVLLEGLRHVGADDSDR